MNKNENEDDEDIGIKDIGYDLLSVCLSKSCLIFLHICKKNTTKYIPALWHLHL